MEQLKPVVLIVEDEFLLRMNSAAVMEEAGFEVVQAGNADEAIAILGMRSDIEVVLPTFKCPARWTVSSLLGLSGIAGRRSSPSPTARQRLPRRSGA
jgi:DNA-binding NtrC family response regulator